MEYLFLYSLLSIFRFISVTMLGFNSSAGPQLHHPSIGRIAGNGFIYVSK